MDSQAWWLYRYQLPYQHLHATERQNQDSSSQKWYWAPFQDKDAIDKGKLFNAKDQADFDILFSRVKTEATQDVKVHAKHMEDYYKQFTFDDKARMLSVVVHDNLDGDSLLSVTSES